MTRARERRSVCEERVSLGDLGSEEGKDEEMP